MFALVALGLGIAAATGAFAATTIKVPAVTGIPVGSATAVVQAAELRVGTITYQQTSPAVALGTVVSQTPKPATSVGENTPVDLVVAGSAATTVPNVAGLPEGSAATVIANADLRLGQVVQVSSSSIPIGLVVDQAPVAGTMQPPGAFVSITVSGGPAPTISPTPTVPNVIGETQEEAVDTLRAAGYQVVVAQAPSTTVAQGLVVSQSPTEGVVTASGSNVTIVISTGP